MIIPLKLGGVNIPLDPNLLIWRLQLNLSKNMMPKASLLVTGSRFASASIVEKGCVGEVISPGTVLCGTGLSSIS
jgi:hypothetical protein